MIWPPGAVGGTLPLFPPPAPSSCWIDASDMPPAWLTKFPTGAEIVRRSVELRALPGLAPDKRLLKRRERQFEIFRSVEEAIELPQITAGWSNDLTGSGGAMLPSYGSRRRIAAKRSAFRQRSSIRVTAARECTTFSNSCAARTIRSATRQCSSRARYCSG